MNDPLMGAQASPSRSWNPFRRRPKPVANPSPQQLAEMLHDHNVHRSAAKRLDDYERAERQAHEEYKAKARLFLGTAGLVLGLSPAVPGVYSACSADAHSWDCGLRGVALVGGALALSGSLWLGWDLYHHDNILTREARRVSEALNRAFHAKAGQVPVDDLFEKYRKLSRDDRRAFTEHLHAFARQPKRGPLANAAAQVLAV